MANDLTGVLSDITNILWYYKPYQRSFILKLLINLDYCVDCGKSIKFKDCGCGCEHENPA